MKKKTTLTPVKNLKVDPNNPRTLNKEKFKKLKKSLENFPEMLDVRPLVVADGIVVGGNMRLRALQELKVEEVPVIDVTEWTQAQRDEFMIKDNLTFGDWDYDILANEWEGTDLQEWGLDIWADDVPPAPGLTDKDDIPEQDKTEPKTKLGDVWQLGNHRIMCGDCTKEENLEKLFNGKKADLIHADPPYGMGKQKDGVQNDNLYNEKLDVFQMDWWNTCRNFTIDKGSAYIWGNAPDLWRLWYKGGLADSEQLELRNEIVWDKKTVPGMKSELLHQYPEASERCLYFQFGQQFIGNINADDFPEEYQTMLDFQVKELYKAGIDKKKVEEITGVQMFSHWFTKSQFQIIGEKHYKKLQKETDAFDRDWQELKEEWNKVKGSKTDKAKGMRSYFDNAHDIMRDVWEFPRVVGDERHNHATPKPVDMMERCIVSSCPVGGIVLEPFLGSGSTLIGAEASGRCCYGLELDPVYIDTVVKRWETYTGKKAHLVEEDDLMIIAQAH